MLKFTHNEDRTTNGCRNCGRLLLANFLLLAGLMMTVAFYAKLAQFHALGFSSTRAQAQAIAEVTGQSPTRIYQVLLFIRDQEDILKLMDETIDVLKNA